MAYCRTSSAGLFLTFEIDLNVYTSLKSQIHALKFILYCYGLQLSGLDFTYTNDFNA